MTGLSRFVKVTTGEVVYEEELFVTIEKPAVPFSVSGKGDDLE